MFEVTRLLPFGFIRVVLGVFGFGFGVGSSVKG